MREVNLLRALPQTKRNLTKRHVGQTQENIAAANRFGREYFDGPREQGYGGYYYDGRWVPVAKDIIDHFGLTKNDRVLDAGCAKGFLVKDLLEAGLDLEVYGLDISLYALTHTEEACLGRMVRGDVHQLPFRDDSFAAAICINTIHNLEREDALRAVREIERVAPGRGFIQVDSYYTPEQREEFMRWVLTAKYHDYPDAWVELFKQAGYTGYYYWTILE
ncbi:MAG: class I SAM-dependent methyltransferase [Desulfarculaceae bacterium]|nr:class I SAM-dependent methyltransferase [Desulfarculaceae bacterium]MCF8072948.1 class I SAM-dependent methyltransferase [Desulfarculaceae bacterium]MCF8115497.1 class I SAM-dependent methyltransferase [Desulfarculaceae bacterium]